MRLFEKWKMILKKRNMCQCKRAEWSEAEKVYKHHKACCKDWCYGEMEEKWRDENWYLCIAYASGDWFRYSFSSDFSKFEFFKGKKKR